MSKFSEKQLLLSSRLTSVLLIIIIGIAFLQYYYTHVYEELALMNIVFYTFLYPPLIIIIYIYYGKMELTIDDSDLRIKMWRFSKTIPLGSIWGCRIVDVHMMRDFGGFGYRPGLFGKEQVEGYVFPNQPKGVIFSYKGGERNIVISSTKPEELLDAMCANKTKAYTV